MFEKSSEGNRSSSRDANYHQYRQALRNRYDAAWALIGPMLPAARRGGRPRTTNIRAVLNAIFYLLRTGCQWCLLPREFPVWSTVYHYFRVWKSGGVWTCVQRSMYQQARRQAGRTACPSVLIMDGQSVKRTNVAAFAASTRTSVSKAASAKRRQRAFKITGLTWIVVVERSFACLGRNRRLSQDYEYSVQTSETLIDIAATRLILNRLASA